MPRTKIWQRNYLQDTNPHSSGSLTDEIPQLAGSTLLRLHYSFQLSTHQDAPFSGQPVNMVVLGAFLIDSAGFPTPPDPIADPNDEWLWWEGVSVLSTQHTIVASTYATMQNDTADTNRDIRAQRKFNFNDPVLCWSWNQLHNPSFVPQYTFQIAYSALIELPP